ncbi:alpha-mannosidase [Jeotgalibaca dankookensis]|uniref:alpha-mannosidase n=1 Tax=Jeotgalibaca dankookensis TaxID=708126 RepID=UPI0007845D7C|nr:alpha-mannosidase [Jeotgalibaca dankookensis]
MKKKVHIISHSHWDREWYMAYEQHHMRLILLMDDLLELIEKDPEFNSFHLDGQTIILDDYLEVRPERREAVKEAIANGKLRIGPFYILQDAFLVSSESNTRNILIGMAESKKWGDPVMLGYFPDTFGNMGQTPQMMLQSNLDTAAFGRGVKPVGFDNEVLEDNHYSSHYSEMFWEGPDKSKIFGLLFANWYSNGNEIPTQVEAAKEFWTQKLLDVEKFAATDHYLMMNGVDHQPVQKDISKGIRLANELFPEYEFIHSNFTDYLDSVQKELPESLGTVYGELKSQETDGWFTLANTASTRVYLKQWNTRVSRQLENITEPLAAIAQELTGEYPHDQLDYAWKTLMQNHPHDSICGCSIDEVHREMIPRFEKAHEVGKYLADDALMTITDNIDTSEFPEQAKPFVVFNTTGTHKSGTITLDIELERKTFAEGYPAKLYQELEETPAFDYKVIDTNGKEHPATVTEENVRFGYDLPKERFRIPYMQRYVSVTLEVENMAAFSWETYALIKGKAKVGRKEAPIVSNQGNLLENKHVKLEITENGTLTVTSKASNKKVANLLVFEDVGDIGNEYIFKQPKGDQALLSTHFPFKVEVIENSELLGKVQLTHFMKVPKSADNRLAKEQQAVVDFRYREAQRAEELIPFTIKTIISLDAVSGHVEFETHVDNQAEDHRLRVLFPTDINAEEHEADSIYEVVKRRNKVSRHWLNPANPQHQHAFVNLHTQEYGLTLTNFGLNEYEIFNQTIAITLLRSVGELGDWGYFATPEAQCKGHQSFHYALEIHGQPATRYKTYQNAHAWQVPFVAQQTALHTGTLPANKQYITIDGEHFAVTALKRRRHDNNLVLRGYNLADQETDLVIKKNNQGKLSLLNLLEEEVGQVEDTLKPYEIRTVGISEEE